MKGYSCYSYFQAYVCTILFFLFVLWGHQRGVHHLKPYICIYVSSHRFLYVLVITQFEWVRVGPQLARVFVFRRRCWRCVRSVFWCFAQGRWDGIVDGALKLGHFLAPCILSQWSCSMVPARQLVRQ